MTENAMWMLAADTAKEGKPLIVRMTTLSCIKLLKKLASSNKDLKVLKVLSKIEPSSEVLTKIGWIAGGWAVHAGDKGVLISVKRMIIIYKTTFKGCMRFTNGNLAVTCTMSLISSILAIMPGYNYNNHFILIAQTLIRMAYLDIRVINDLKGELM
jgi:uncharacterized membrane protein